MKKLCCCSLRTGCICIAVYCLLFGIFGLYYSISVLGSGFSPAGICGLLISAMFFLSAVGVLVGIRPKKTSYLMIWFVVTILRLFVEVGLLVLETVLLIKRSYIDTSHYDHGQKETLRYTDREAVLLVAFLAVDICLSVYFLAATYNYRRLLLGQSNGTGNIKKHLISSSTPFRSS